MQNAAPGSNGVPVPQHGGTPSAARSLRLVMLGVLIGLPAALFAALFLAFIHTAQGWLWTDLPDALGASSPPWYLVMGLPIAGAAIVGGARRFLPGDGGHSPLLGIGGGGAIAISAAPGIALAAIATLAFGAVLGPEAPLIALGAVIGETISLCARLDDREEAVVATAGSFSAISALFGGPLVAGMLLVESSLGLGPALIPVLLPGLVAAAVGYVVFLGLGTWGGLHKAGLVVPDLPVYHHTSIRDLLLAVAVGVVAAMVIAPVRAFGTRVESYQSKVSMPAVLIAGGAAVGALAELARLLGANSQDVLFSGQASVPVVVAETSIKIVLVLLVAKAIGYAVCLGCGFRGGPVFPPIFIGVALASVVEIMFHTSPTLAVAIGAAAGMAASTRLLFAPILFSALLVGTNGLNTISAAVLAAVAAWITTAAIADRAAHSARSAGAGSTGGSS